MSNNQQLFEVMIYEVENGYVVSDRMVRDTGMRPAREWVARNTTELGDLIVDLARRTAKAREETTDV